MQTLRLLQYILYMTPSTPKHFPHYALYSNSSFTIKPEIPTTL